MNRRLDQLYARSVFHGLSLLLIWTLPVSAQESTRIVFFAPTRPAIIEFELSTGRFSIDEMRRRYSAEVFQLLDLNADNQLSPAEAREIPAEGRLRVGVRRLGEDWEQVDTAPKDGSVSADELTTFIGKALGAPLTIEKAPPKLSATVRLFSDLDVNKDQIVSDTEIENGMKILHAFDFDDDETLSVAELQPFPLSVIQARQQVADDETPAPIHFIRDNDEITAAVTAVLDHYGQTEKVPHAVISDLSEREFRRFDLNNDGAWGNDDLTLFLKRAPADYVMQVSLSPPQVQVVRGKFTGDRRPTTILGKLPVEWVARNNAYQQYDATRLYLVRFIMVDSDKNKYLDEMEFAGLQASVAFEAVDLDGNQQVTREEIKFFFSMDGLAAQSRLILSLSNETKTLFEILDTNLDRRLHLKEFLAGRENILTHDLNQDNALRHDELDSQFRITFTQPQILETLPAPNQPGMMQQRQGVVSRENSGPVWFRRMDDNLDGEVSWREFLGPRNRFDELDLNQDMFLDLSEANEAESMRADDS